MTGDDLLLLMLSTLLRRHGGSNRAWRMVVGPIRIHDSATHSHRNWSVSPNGSARQVAAVEEIVDDLAGRHPIVED